MPLVPTRLLLIHRQLDFAVTVKKSLEQIGGFEVAPFTASDTALEYLRTRPHDIALIDFTLRGVPGVDLIARMRAIQPDIAIIVTPKTSETLGAMRDFALQEVIDTPLPVRQLIPVLLKAVQRARETLLPDTAEAPSMEESDNIAILPPEFSPTKTPLDVIPAVEYGMETIEVDMSDLDPSSESPSEAIRQVISVFETLAAEEPPMPGVEEHGTLRDLREGLLDTGERVVVELLNANQALSEARPLPPDDGERPDEPVLARKILEGTLDHTSPLKPLMEAVAPESPSVKMAAVLDEAEAQQEQADRQPLESAGVTGTPPPPTPSPLPPVLPASRQTPSQTPAAPVPPPTPPVLPEVRREGTRPQPVVTPQPAPSPSLVEQALSEEAQLAQMAVDLTQASLESTAEATLLSRHGEVIACAGKLAPEDIEYLRERIAGDRAATGESQSRIRFINLPGSGKDYMLFSRHTEGDLILTMVFAGNMPLRVIRRQSDKLLAALSAVPEASAPTIEDLSEAGDLTMTAEGLVVEESGTFASVRISGDEAAASEIREAVESEVPEVAGETVERAIAPVYSGPLVPFTFIWMLRDPDHPIPDAVSQAIIAGLDTYLTQQGWTANTLRIHEDYIYLAGAMPADLPANQIITALKTESARLAAARMDSLDPATLWADSYYALMPGRELSAPEIQRFIRFGRMR